MWAAKVLEVMPVRVQSAQAFVSRRVLGKTFLNALTSDAQQDLSRSLQPQAVLSWFMGSLQ